MNEDMSQFLGVFLQEAAEQMELLEQDILKLEQGASQELLQGIFRAAHTLKGSSRAMGLTSLGELTHAMEDVFDQLRHDQLTVTPPLIDALFAGLDSIKVMLEEIAAGGTTDVDTTQQTASLRAVLAGAPGAQPAKAATVFAMPTGSTVPTVSPMPTMPSPVAMAPPPTETAPPSATPVASMVARTVLSVTQANAYQDALANGYEVYGLTVELAADCLMKSVRVMMVLQALEHTGSILATTPDEEALENEEFGTDFEVVIATRQAQETVQKAALSVNEVRTVHIARWQPATRPDEPAATGTGKSDKARSAPNSGFKTRFTVEAGGAYQDALANGYEVYGLTVELAADCLMKSVRVMMVLQALEHTGSILATTPDEEALENEEFGADFEVVIATRQAQETVQKAALSVNEVRTVYIARWQADGESAATFWSATPPPSIPATPALVPATPAVVPAAKAPSPPPPAPDVSKVSAASGASEATEAPVRNARIADAGPEARGKAPEEVQKLAAEKAADKKGTAQPATVRVDVTRLDSLLNLIGELVIDRTRITQLGTQLERQYGVSPLIEHLNETATHVGRITDELQNEIMKARMLPIDNVFNRFPRMIRDLAQKLGKEINFVIEGRETELDRSVIEVVGDPLIHMLRNSVDHGVEMPDDREKAGKPRVGTVWLSARHQENHIVIEVEDDGKGIDPEGMRANAVKKGLMSRDAANRLTDTEAIHLIFASGFSTAQVVSDVSGRGVGMDIVRSNLQKLGALIEIDSRVGHGSKFTVKLPLTLAIIRGLLITVRGDVYALPLSSVVETLRLEPTAVQHIKQRPVVYLRGKTLPLVRLSDLFPLAFPAQVASGNPELAGRADNAHAVVTASARPQGGDTAGSDAQPPRQQPLYVVVIGVANRQLGLIVDSLVGEQEVVIKTLGKFVGDIRGISGATILGDGHMALIVDCNGIMTLALDEKGMAHAA